MSNISKIIVKINPLSVCSTTPSPDPPHKLYVVLQLWVSQVDLLCATPLKNYMTPCQIKLTGTLMDTAVICMSLRKCFLLAQERPAT